MLDSPRLFFSAIQDKTIEFNDEYRPWRHKVYEFIHNNIWKRLPIFSRVTLFNVAALSVVPADFIMFSTSWYFLPVIVASPVVLNFAIKAKRYCEFRDEKESRMLELNKIPKPLCKHPREKNRTDATFNYALSFTRVEHDGKFYYYYAPRTEEGEKPNWQILYVPEKYQHRLKDAKMIASGANFKLFVPTEDGTKYEIVYYKVLKEKFDKNGKLHVSCKAGNAMPKESWFSLPWLRLLKPSQLYAPLYIDIGNKFASSHSGKFRKEVVIKNRVFKNWGSTMVYDIPSGRRIRKNDPFVEKHSITTASLPLMVEELEPDADASEFCFIGKSEHSDEKVLHHRYLDYDIMHNPIMGYSHAHHKPESEPNLRLLPVSFWQEVKLPAARYIIGNPYVIQTGCGNEAIQFCFNSFNDSKERGIYYYTLSTKHWKFHKDDSVTGEIREIKSLSFIAFDQHYQNDFRAVGRYKLNERFISEIKIKKFNSHNDNTKIEITANSKTYSLLLFKKKRMIASFMRPEGLYWPFSWAVGKMMQLTNVEIDYWQLAADPDHPLDMMELFAKPVSDIKVDFSEDNLSINIADIGQDIHFEKTACQTLSLDPAADIFSKSNSAPIVFKREEQSLGTGCLSELDSSNDDLAGDSPTTGKVTNTAKKQYS